MERGQGRMMPKRAPGLGAPSLIELLSPGAFYLRRGSVCYPLSPNAVVFQEPIRSF